MYYHLKVSRICHKLMHRSVVQSAEQTCFEPTHQWFVILTMSLKLIRKV